MDALSAKITADLTNETYIKLALAISFPLIVYVLLLVATKGVR